jgi:hypothetical protein
MCISLDFQSNIYTYISRIKHQLVLYMKYEKSARHVMLEYTSHCSESFIR